MNKILQGDCLDVMKDIENKKKQQELEKTIQKNKDQGVEV